MSFHDPTPMQLQHALCIEGQAVDFFRSLSEQEQEQFHGACALFFDGVLRSILRYSLGKQLQYPDTELLDMLKNEGRWPLKLEVFGFKLKIELRSDQQPFVVTSAMRVCH